MDEKVALFWTLTLELKLLASYKKVSKNTKLVASGGKNLQLAGWRQVLNDFSGSGVTSIDQLHSTWRRLKVDWADYKYLVNLSGFGDEWDSEKWSELDKNRGKLKLSRFRDKPFLHYDVMSDIVGDCMATGGNIIATENDETDVMHGNLSASQKRAKVLDQLKRNRKRKQVQQNEDSKDIRLKALVNISNSLDSLVKLYAAKNNLSLGQALQSDDESKDEP
ncbi:hypothetical protein AC1031_008281 [Aphanomyces cochlioides]|nr:hypothetical protein AC1031_008281 [Aphanomyces cochlioides]